jgi:hypothetical protein
MRLTSWAMAQNQKVALKKERPGAQEESTKQRFDGGVECDSKPRTIMTEPNPSFMPHQDQVTSPVSARPVS